MIKKPTFKYVCSMKHAFLLCILFVNLNCNTPKYISESDLDNNDISQGELGEDYFIVDNIDGFLSKDKLKLTGRVHTDLGFPLGNVIITSTTKKANDTLLYEKDLGQSDTSGLFSIEILNPTQGNILLSFKNDFYLTRIYNVSSLVESKFNRRNKLKKTKE